MCRPIESPGPLLAGTLFGGNNLPNANGGVYEAKQQPAYKTAYANPPANVYPNVMCPANNVFTGGYDKYAPQQQQQQLNIPFEYSDSMATAYPMGNVKNACELLDSTAATANSQENLDVDVGNFEDLLDYSIPDDKEDEQVDLFNMEEEFDNTEMSILYSFLMDSQAEQQKASKLPNDDCAVLQAVEQKDKNNSLDFGDNSILTVNLLDDNPLDALLELTSEEDLSDIELKPPADYLNTKPEELFNLEAPKAPPKKSRRLCKMEGCEKRSRSHGLCIAHGGGRRCSVEGCDKSSQGGNLCIRHGGGKRCMVDGCEKAAQSNMLCKAHGGGPRCQYRGCDRSSQGGGFCRSHGGGKRCLYEGCDKGTQRGDFCALHGGSRLCGITGCMRNDRGGGFCATHGGGKRCNFDGCLKPCRRKGMCSAHLRQVGDQ